MAHLDRLLAATLHAQEADDLPDFLAARILAIVGCLQGEDALQAEVEELTEQLALYDTYGQTGYIGMGVNNQVLEVTIRRLEGKLTAAGLRRPDDPSG